MSVIPKGPALALMMIPLSALSGCRFGNKVEKAPDPDQVSGYYETEPQELVFSITTSTTHVTHSSVSMIPIEVSEGISNPVALLMTDLEKGEAFLTNKNGNGYGIPVFVLPDRTLEIVASAQPRMVWDDPACTTQFALEIGGTYTDQPASHEDSASGLPIKGRIAADISVYRTIDGTCAASLQSARDCYQDANQCGGSTAAENAAYHQDYVDFFGPYIEAGAMTVNDILTVRTLSYRVSYR